MITVVTYPTTTPFLRPEIYLTACVLFHETITYPIAHVGIRSTARIYNFTKKNFLNHKESYIIFSDLQKQGSLFRGLRAGLDKQVSKQILRYYSYHYLLFKYAHKDYISPNYNPELDQDDQPYSPESPELYPLLKYESLNDYRVLIVAAIANLIGIVASQPVNILGTLLQIETLQQNEKKLIFNEKMKTMKKFYGNNRVFIQPGFNLRFTRNYFAFLSELWLYQRFLKNDSYPFMNVFFNRTKQLPSSSIVKPAFEAFYLTALITTITQPLYIIEQRQIASYLQKQQFSAFKGVQMVVSKGTQVDSSETALGIP